MNISKLIAISNEYIKINYKSKYSFNNFGNNFQFNYNNKKFDLYQTPLQISVKIQTFALYNTDNPCTIILEKVDFCVKTLLKKLNIENNNWIGYFDVHIFHSVISDEIIIDVLSNVINVNETIRREDFNNKLENLLED